MPKKISVDEIMSKRKDLQSGTASIIKAAKAPASWNKEKRTARFVMNSQAVDRYGDVVVTAGIDTAEFEKNPVALLFHSSRSWPVGTWSDLEKVLSGRPPRIEGTLNLLPSGGPVKEIDECAWMIANGGIRACSIGFIPDWDDYELILDDEGQWTYGVKFNRSILTECSVVSVPAAPAALVKDAANMGMAREIIEDILDNYTKTPEGLILPRSEYEAAHKEVSGNPTSVVVRVKVDEDGEFKAVAEQEREEVEASIKAIDETEGLPEATKETLIQRGMVFCTELKSENKTYAGYVLAKSHDDAEAIVAERGGGETVLGALAEERDVESSTRSDVVEHDKAVGEIHIGLHVDGNIEETKKNLEDLEATADRVEKRFEGIFARISKFFGGSEKAIERIEPEITLEPEVKSPPTEDEINAAKACAVALLERTARKGLIEA